jgi:diguanylate cyclase (GGDEF)-like protein
MKHKITMGPSFKELVFVIIFSFIITLIMSFLNAYERLFLFTRMYRLYEFDEFAVFFPSFLAMGVLLISYRQIQRLEIEVNKRQQAEKVLRENEQRYRDLSITDNLTQLHNSRHFYNILQSEIDRSIRYNHPLSLLLMDIDNFKHYNDTYGHLEGDKVLSSLGSVVQERLRRTDSAYRYGGEEFTVILPVTEREEALNVAERIRKGFEAEIFSPKPNEEVHITVSIGASQYIHGEKIESFIKKADKAMYAAKDQGKNRVSFLEGAYGDQYARSGS